MENNTVEIYIEQQAFEDMQDEYRLINPSYRKKTYAQFCAQGRHILTIKV